MFPIGDFATELALVKSETARLLQRSGVPMTPSDELLEVLVTTFRELRGGETGEGQPMERLSAVLSTAEAVSVAHSVGVRGYYLRGDGGSPADLVECLAGTAAKDNPEDLKRLRAYFEQRVARRGSPSWRALYEARHLLPG